jgi:hypothetical protein
MGLANYKAPAGFNHPLKPTRVPSAGEPALVHVNHQPLTSSGLTDHDTFVFRKDSAGLGVPRGSLGKLNSYSGETIQHGMAQTSVYSGARGEGQHGGTEEASAANSASQRGSNSSSMSSMPSASAPGGSHGSAGASSGGGHR